MDKKRPSKNRIYTFGVKESTGIFSDSTVDMGFFSLNGSNR